jgi:hypothetical protein
MTYQPENATLTQGGPYLSAGLAAKLHGLSRHTLLDRIAAAGLPAAGIVKPPTGRPCRVYHAEHLAALAAAPVRPQGRHA